MHKLLIVDDEKLIREGLVTYIDWASLGIEFAGVCATAAEALRRVRETSIDVVLTDIRMPGMDGIELLKKLKEIAPGCEVVFISAYRNFEYARNALRYGAFDYVPKPIEESALYDTMRRCIAHMAEPSSGAVRAPLAAALDELRLYLLSGLHDPAVWPRLALSLDVPADGVTRVEILTCQDGEGARLVGAEAAVRVEEMTEAGSRVLLLTVSDREVVALAFGTASVPPALSEPKPPLLAGWSSRPTVQDPAPLYAEASWAVIALSIHGERRCISWDEVRSRLERHAPKPLSAPEAADELLAEQEPDVTALAWRLFAPLAAPRSRGDIAALRLEASRFADEVIDELDRYPSLVDAVAALEPLHRAVVRGHSPHSIHASTRAYLASLGAIVRRRLPPGTSRRIADAINLVRDDPRSAASLADVARQLQVSPGYLSRTFRREMDESFSAFRSRTRIEKACELLQDHRYKVYEVADLVGFNDVTHFTRVFTRVTGVSPSDYRRPPEPAAERPGR